METFLDKKTKDINHITILEELFGSESRAKVLLVLLTNPKRRFYQRQIEFATQLPLRAVQRELERFTQIGLLYTWKEGNRTWYQLKFDDPFVNRLQSLILSISPPYDRLRAILHTKDSVRLALLNKEENKALVVLNNGPIDLPEELENYKILYVDTQTFLEKINKNEPEMLSFLQNAVDLLGNREDLIWRSIEMIPIQIPKGEHVL